MVMRPTIQLSAWWIWQQFLGILVEDIIWWINFLGNYNFQILTQTDTHKINVIIKDLPPPPTKANQTKAPGPDDFMEKFYQDFQEQIILMLF